jgi:carbonic anhydrase
LNLKDVGIVHNWRGKLFSSLVILNKHGAYLSKVETKMHKNVIVYLFLLFISNAAVANTWVTLHQDSNAKLLLDKQSILQKDQLTRAWVKVEYKTPQVNIDSADKAYNLSKLLWYFDCGAQKTATSQVFQYMDDEAVYSAAIDIKGAEFIVPVPESDLDIAMRFVCAGRKPAEIKQTVIAKPELAKMKADKKIAQKTETADKPVEAKPEAKAEPSKTDQAKPAAVKAETTKVEATKVDTSKVEKANAENTKTEASKNETTKDKNSKTDAHEVHWTYEGKEGPENWAKLKPDFATCDSGRNQSPINIDETIDAPLKPLKGIQKVAIREILNNGHTIQANFKQGNMLLLDNVGYQMKQVHFHAPSENTIHGQSFPLEAHFVHADSKGNLAVIGVMFKEGKANPGLEKLWQQIPKEESAPFPLKVKVSASDLMPDNRDYFRFSGSLTTPPCSEGVRWILLKTPITASKSQIEVFEAAVKHHNNRPVQPLNGRVVVE